MEMSAVRIFVRDFAEAKDFYTCQLGLQVEISNEQNGFCMFNTGATKLIVETINDEDDEEHQGLVGRFTGITFPVEDIRATHRQLSAAGVEFSGAPEEQYWGGWLATFKDPAGNGLQLVQQPAQQAVQPDRA